MWTAFNNDLPIGDYLQQLHNVRHNFTKELQATLLQPIINQIKTHGYYTRSSSRFGVVNAVHKDVKTIKQLKKLNKNLITIKQLKKLNKNLITIKTIKKLNKNIITIIEQIQKTLYGSLYSYITIDYDEITERDGKIILPIIAFKIYQYLTIEIDKNDKKFDKFITFIFNFLDMKIMERHKAIIFCSHFYGKIIIDLLNEYVEQKTQKLKQKLSFFLSHKDKPGNRRSLRIEKQLKSPSILIKKDAHGNRRSLRIEKQLKQNVKTVNKFGKNPNKSNKISSMTDKELKTKLKSVGIRITKEINGHRRPLTRKQLEQKANAFKNLQLLAKKKGIKLMYKSKKRGYVYKSYTRINSELQRRKKN